VIVGADKRALDCLRTEGTANASNPRKKTNQQAIRGTTACAKIEEAKVYLKGREQGRLIKGTGGVNRADERGCVLLIHRGGV